MAEKDMPDTGKRVLTVESAQHELLETISARLAGIDGITAKRPQETDDHSLDITRFPDIPYGSLSVLDVGTVRWEYCPEDREKIDARQTANIVTALITDESEPYEEIEDFHGNGTGFKGIVGRDLMARGLAVKLEVFEDYSSFSADADIVVTKKRTISTDEDAEDRGKTPARDQCDTRAYVDDSGFISCDIEYWGEVHAEAIAEDVARRIRRVVKSFAISGNSTIIRSEDE